MEHAEEQYRKMDAHFFWINACLATELLICFKVQPLFFSYFELKISNQIFYDKSSSEFWFDALNTIF